MHPDRADWNLTEHDLIARAEHAVDRSVRTKQRLARTTAPQIAQLAIEVHRRLAAGGKLLIFGNGGSASDAQHIAAELVGRYVRERPGMPAIALNTDTSAITAIGNDYGYESVFSRQVEALGAPGDVVLGISTSGNSPNVLAALQVAKERSMFTAAFVGGRSSKCHALADITIGVPATETARVQESHILLGHILCELLDARDGDRAAPVDPVHVGVDEALLARRAGWREANLRVVLTNGVFDMLHVGHLTSLQAARALGDVLVVAINDDESVGRLKGPARPIVPAVDRARLLAALEVVDEVVIFGESDTSAVLRELQPDVWCKGSEYADRDRATIPEIPVVESYGGTVEFLPMQQGWSTTSTIDRLRATTAP